MDVKDGEFGASARGGMAVEHLARLMGEREKTRRLLIATACLFFVIAAAIVVFAPAGRENLAMILGAALVIFSLGAIGVARFSFKVPGVSVTAGNTGSEEPAEDDRRHQAHDADGTNIPA